MGPSQATRCRVVCVWDRGFEPVMQGKGIIEAVDASYVNHDGGECGMEQTISGGDGEKAAVFRRAIFRECLTASSRLVPSK